MGGRSVRVSDRMDVARWSFSGFTVGDQTLTFGVLPGAFDANVLLVAAAATGIAAAGVAAAPAVGAAAGGLLRGGVLRHRRWPFCISRGITDSPFPAASNTTRERGSALGARQGVMRWRKRGAT